MAERNSGDVMLAFLLGGIIGAALGVLYAPCSGKETRQRIKEMGEDLGDKFDTITDDVKNRTQQAVNEGKNRIMSTKERLEEAFKAGKKVYEEKAGQ